MSTYQTGTNPDSWIEFSYYWMLARVRYEHHSQAAYAATRLGKLIGQPVDTMRDASGDFRLITQYRPGSRQGTAN